MAGEMFTGNYNESVDIYAGALSYFQGCYVDQNLASASWVRVLSSEPAQSRLAAISSQKIKIKKYIDYNVIVCNWIDSKDI